MYGLHDARNGLPQRSDSREFFFFFDSSRPVSFAERANRVFGFAATSKEQRYPEEQASNLFMLLLGCLLLGISQDYLTAKKHQRDCEAPWILSSCVFETSFET